jgi:hypothetical protein
VKADQLLERPRVAPLRARDQLAIRLRKLVGIG